jgi:glycogen synthase
MSLKAVVITHQKITWDSRIQRILETVASAGYDVILLSADSKVEIKGLHSHHAIPESNATRVQFLRNLITRGVTSAATGLALPLHRWTTPYDAIVQKIVAIKPDIIHANDWMTLPSAVDAASVTGAKVIYDTHEVAAQEHAEHLWWRLAMRPHIETIEAAMIGRADHVITVSDGIATFLTNQYPEKIKNLTVIRNLPRPLETFPQLRGDEKVRLVYVGLIRPERCLETMIQAIALLPPRYTLEIRGFGPPRYLAKLVALVDTLRLNDRVRWADPVLPAAIVSQLSANDIGLYLSQGLNVQKQHAMPNKIFEYLCAGMAIISAGSLEVKTFLERHGNGVSLADVSAPSLADAIISLDEAKLISMKKRSRKASSVVNWNHEAKKLVAIYASLIKS